jgi:phosphate starvation-inducible PhoH-like protein
LEKILEIEGLNPVAFFGVNNSNLLTIKRYFPLLKIIARGTQLTIIGEDEIVLLCDKKIQQVLDYFHRFNQLSENIIEQIMLEDVNLKPLVNGDEVLVHGNGGSKIKAKTINQQRLVANASKNEMVFAVGPAGTGKTYTAIALAVKALKAKEVKRIILTRPAVEAGENLGFLPGDLKEKLDPYMMPLYDALRDMIPPEKLKDMIEFGIIEIAPLAFMRGRTLDNAFVILDEAQNTTIMQMKMFLTRMGQTAQFMITGDMSQIDLPPRQRSGLAYALDILDGVEGIGVVRLSQQDVIRHPLVKKIIDAFEKQEKIDKEKKNLTNNDK